MKYIALVTYMLPGSSTEYKQAFSMCDGGDDIPRSIEGILIAKWNYIVLDIKIFKQEPELNLDHEKVQSMIKELKQKHKKDSEKGVVNDIQNNG